MQGTFTRELAVVSQALRDYIEGASEAADESPEAEAAVDTAEALLSRAEALAQLPEEEIARLVEAARSLVEDTDEEEDDD